MVLTDLNSTSCLLTGKITGFLANIEQEFLLSATNEEMVTLAVTQLRDHLISEVRKFLCDMETRLLSHVRSKVPPILSNSEEEFNSVIPMDFATVTAPYRVLPEDDIDSSMLDSQVTFGTSVSQSTRDRPSLQCDTLSSSSATLLDGDSSLQSSSISHSSKRPRYYDTSDMGKLLRGEIFRPNWADEGRKLPSPSYLHTIQSFDMVGLRSLYTFYQMFNLQGFDTTSPTTEKDLRKAWMQCFEGRKAPVHLVDMDMLRHLQKVSASNGSSMKGTLLDYTTPSNAKFRPPFIFPRSAAAAAKIHSCCGHVHLSTAILHLRSSTSSCPMSHTCLQGVQRKVIYNAQTLQHLSASMLPNADFSKSLYVEDSHHPYDDVSDSAGTGGKSKVSHFGSATHLSSTDTAFYQLLNYGIAKWGGVAIGYLQVQPGFWLSAMVFANKSDQRKQAIPVLLSIVVEEFLHLLRRRHNLHPSLHLPLPCGLVGETIRSLK